MDVAPDPARYLPTVLVHLSLRGVAEQLEDIARSTDDIATEGELMDLAGELRRACETPSV